MTPVNDGEREREREGGGGGRGRERACTVIPPSVGPSMKNVLFCRCKCGHCDAEPEIQSLFCCVECPQLETKRQGSSSQSNLQCITQHRGFQVNCLEPEVLLAVYNHYRCQYGEMDFDQSRYAE